MRSALMLFILACASLPVYRAQADGADPNPPWQTATAARGEAAVLRISLDGLPRDASAATVTIPDVGPLEAQVLAQYGELHVRIPPRDAPLSFRDYRIRLADGAAQTVTMPTEVHWLDSPESGPVLRASTLLTGRPGSLAVLLENNGNGTLELTDFRYAPAAVSTGRLAVLRDPPAAAADLDVDLPYFDTRGEFRQDLWEGLPFEGFSFADGSLPLAPGEQVLLALGAEAFTSPEMFDVAALFELNVWVSYTSAGVGHSLLLFSESRRPGP